MSSTEGEGPKPYFIPVEKHFRGYHLCDRTLLLFSCILAMGQAHGSVN